MVRRLILRPLLPQTMRSPRQASYHRWCRSVHRLRRPHRNQDRCGCPARHRRRSRNCRLQGRRSVDRSSGSWSICS